jgi:L-rhamnose mutarotase
MAARAAAALVEVLHVERRIGGMDRAARRWSGIASHYAPCRSLTVARSRRADPASIAPMRHAFTMRLRPGALEAYRDHHRAVWPELERQFRKAGIDRFSILEAGGLIVIVSEIRDEDAWERLGDTPIHRLWSALMAPLLACSPDGTIDTVEMTEVYRYEDR